jgi:hypothetical protein
MSAASYSTPSRQQVLDALARMGGKLQFRRGFYGKLQNPNWVAALDSERAFSNPPAVRTESDGTMRVDPWPEIDYLVRMAPLAPEPVARVFGRVATSDNPWIRRAVLEGLGDLPADLSAPIAAHVGRWAAGPRADFLHPPHLARYIVRLYQGGRPQEARKVADAFFKPTRARVQGRRGRRSHDVAVDDYWYGETFPLIASAMGSDRLDDLKRWLEDYQRFAAYYKGNPAYDFSEMWRPSVAPGGGRGYYEMGDALVDAVRAAALEGMRADPADTTTRLTSSEQPLLHRIALDTCAEIVETWPDDGSLVDEQSNLNVVVAGLLKTPHHSDGGIRIEYARFIRACAARRDVIDLSPLWDVIRRGPAQSDERLHAMYQQSQLDLTEDAIEAEVVGFKERWRHQLLATIGPDLLPDDLTEALADFEARFGVIAEPVPSREFVARYPEPQVSITIAAMKSMSDDELIARLLAWEPDGAGFGSPTYADQGHVLKQLITDDPSRFTNVADRVIDLRATYTRSIISGWQAAVSAGRAAPWTLVADMCERVANQPVDHQTTTSYDDDVDYRYAKSEVARLFDTALSAHGPTSEDPLPDDIVRRFLATLVRLADDEPAVRGEASLSQSDPLTLSMNEYAPIVVRALTRLVAWEEPAEVRATSLQVLHNLIHSEDPDVAIAAALGEAFARLYLADEEWLARELNDLFGGPEKYSAFQQAALSTALATHHPHPRLIRPLREPLLNAIGHFGANSPVLGWRNMRSYEQLIGDWIVNDHIRGNLPTDDELVAAFFDRATPEERGDVIGHVAWSMMHADEVDEAILERTKQLFDRRLAHVRSHSADAAELGDFHWFVRSSKFEIEWWLPRLVEVVELYSGFEPKGMIGESLGDAADVNPAAALTVIEVLLESRGKDDLSTRYDITENAAPKVLARALDVGGGLTERAIAVMNELGQAGFIDLDERVQAFRRGA